MAATLNLKQFQQPQSVDCPHCSKSITVYDAIGSEYIICPGCHSYLHFNGSKYYVKEKVEATYDPLLPLGATGTLFNIPYKVLGYMEKKEVDTGYAWREYMLYNFSLGYAFLAEYNGNWILVAGKKHYPFLDKIVDYGGGEMSVDDQSCRLFNTYRPMITGIIGEYDWDVLNERISASEYISPPNMLVKEENLRDHVIDYYWGTYINADEIASAFKIPVENFPEKAEIGACEPSGRDKRFYDVLRATGILVVIVLLVQLLLAWMKPAETLLDSPFTFQLQTNLSPADSMSNAYSGTYEMKSFRTPTFVVDHDAVPLTIGLESSVDNNWFEATVELVNEKDNQTWDISKEIEYYHGYEDGESWSEGSTTESVIVSAVPEGKYHLNVYPYAGASTTNQMNIKVTEGEILWRNILVTVLLLLLYPTYCWYRMRKFETDRWANSDYSPYKKTSTDND